MSKINGRITNDKQDKDNKNIFFAHDIPRQVPILVSQQETTNINFRVALDSSANVFVAGSGNHRIQKFESGGTFNTKCGFRGSADGQFKYPEALAIKSSNVTLLEERVFVVDGLNNRIQVFKPKFVINP